MRKVQIALLAMMAGALTLNSTANAEGWFTEMDDAREVALADVIRNPEAYIDVEVKIKVYFNDVGGTYNPYFTRFTEEMYGNFSAWPIDARLYERRDYERSYGYFFCQRSKKVWKELKKVKQVTSIEVLGAVRETFKGQAWIEVFDFQTIDDGLTKSDVRNVVAGDAYALAGRHGDAVARYEKAVSSRLPKSVQADVYRKLADARYHSGDYDGAASAYEAAQRSAPESVVLKRGVEASKAAHERARAQERGKPFEALTVTPAPSTEPVIAGHKNGVDAIIQLLEDPAKVEAEVAEWRIQLEKRAALIRDGAKVEVVAGDKADDESKEAAAPEGVDTAEKVEETETPDVEVDGCGCAADASDVEVEAVEVEKVETEKVETEKVETEKVETEKVEAEKVEAEKVEAEEVETEEVETEKVETEKVEVEKVEDGSGDVVVEPSRNTVKVKQPEVEAPANEVNVDPSRNTVKVKQPATETPANVATENKVEVKVKATDEKAPEAEVVQVADRRMMLPRLPFFGCEDVTNDDLLALLDEIARSPER